MRSMMSRFVMVAMCLFFGCGPDTGSPADGHATHVAPRFDMLSAGDSMPVFEGVGLDGTRVKVGPGTGLTLINLWATWCGPCIEEFPDLEKLHREMGHQGLRVLGINVDEMDADHIRAFVDELGATFTIALDPGADYQDTVGAVAMPMSFLVGDDGLLIRKWTGRMTEAQLEEVRQLVRGAVS